MAPLSAILLDHLAEWAWLKVQIPLDCKERATRAFFIGEVGLDFSPEGKSTADLQIELFQFVLESIMGMHKFVCIHSRRAEPTVLEMLRAANRTSAVFHWYSGSLAVMRRVIEDGHYCSVNTAILNNINGRRILGAIPRDRFLTETDGPFVTVAGRTSEPSDVRLVEDGMAKLWKVDASEVRATVVRNFRAIVGLA